MADQDQTAELERLRGIEHRVQQVRDHLAGLIALHGQYTAVDGLALLDMLCAVQTDAPVPRPPNFWRERHAAIMADPSIVTVVSFSAR